METIKDALGTVLQEAIKDPNTLSKAESLYTAIFKTGPTKLVIEVYNESTMEGEDMDDIKHYVEMDLGEKYDDCKYRHIVYTCNYKGEGENWVFVEDAEYLPVFVNKDQAAKLFI